jgi:hypothetical protein
MAQTKITQTIEFLDPAQKLAVQWCDASKVLDAL